MANVRFFQKPKSVKTVLTIALAVTVLVCLLAIAPVLWTAVSEITTQQSDDDPHQCLVIKDDASRLECLETRVGKPPPPPARGAKVPSSIFGTGDEAKAHLLAAAGMAEAAGTKRG